jgi:hypothetical protein
MTKKKLKKKELLPIPGSNQTIVDDPKQQKIMEILVRERSLKEKRGAVKHNNADSERYKFIAAKNFTESLETKPDFRCPYCESDKVQQITFCELSCNVCKHKFRA